MYRLETGGAKLTLPILEIISKAVNINTIELFKFND
jgi:hypothetical protein